MAAPAFVLPVGATTSAGGAVGLANMTKSLTALMPGGVATAGTGVQVRMAIDGSQTAWWCWGDGPAVVGTSTPSLPGSVEVFTMPVGCLSVSYIAAATGSNAWITPGTGA